MPFYTSRPADGTKRIDAGLTVKRNKTILFWLYDVSVPTDLMNPSNDLPVPQDNGAASHLKGMKLPYLVLESTRGGVLDLSGIQNWPVIYCYLMSGCPAVLLPEGWNAILGARGYSRKAVRSGIITGNCNSRGRKSSIRATRHGITRRKWPDGCICLSPYRVTMK